MNDPRRRLPAVSRLLELPGVAHLLAIHPRNVVVAAAREVLALARHDTDAQAPDWEAAIADTVARRVAPSLYPMLNATGVVLHTNLGRAPLAQAAIDAAVRVAGGYSNLEFDVATGSRGSRLDHCTSLLAEATGAEDAMVVNNAAGALVLALNAVAAGREVIISRGELVEIGGSFRIPDILEKSGAVLREVGTTNRTHLADYREALSERTGAILVVHRSNFAMHGFVTSPALPDLAALARERGVPLIHDVGSGLLVDLSPFGLSGEPLVQAAVTSADLVVFSGDKLLGGPQAGCVAGGKSYVSRLRRNAFARAMRTDKFTLAALEATLALYRDPAVAIRSVPVLAMLTASPEAIEAKATRLLALTPAPFRPAVVPTTSAVGGGSFPDAVLPSHAVALTPADGAASLALHLRLGEPAVLARVEADRVLLDLRTLPAEAFDAVGQALADAAP